MIEFQRADLEDCHQARGAVVVIDVLRAFTTAAYVFDAGAEAIFLVSTLAEARDLKRRSPGLLLTGEVSGRKPVDFDFGNSPLEFVGADLQGKGLIQRTSAGTQGVVRSTAASVLFAASLCCARATAAALIVLDPPQVTFVITGTGRGRSGDEDAACADYIQSLLCDDPVDRAKIRVRVEESGRVQGFGDPRYPFLDPRDLEPCLQIDRFPFAMRVQAEGNLRVMRPDFVTFASND